MECPPGDITALLNAVKNGDEQAMNRLMPLVYEELSSMAAAHMLKERPDHTFSSTALVHEAYLRLVHQKRVHWSHRRHFFGVAGIMMRRILANHARDRNAQKRSGMKERVALEEDLCGAAAPTFDWLELEDALQELEAQDERLSRVVEMKFFAGMSVEEIAEVLQVDGRTVKRYWKAGKLLLFEKLNRQGS